MLKFLKFVRTKMGGFGIIQLGPFLGKRHGESGYNQQSPSQAGGLKHFKHILAIS